MSFDKIFSHVEKRVKEDPNSEIRRSDDIHIASKIHYAIPSGIPQLDLSLQRPGLPAGRVIEFSGFERSGKTTAALHALANAQSMGGGGLFIDTEFSYDEVRAIALGVDVETNFRHAEVDSLEAIFRTIEYTLEGLIKSGVTKPFVTIVDSVTAVDTERNLALEFGAEPRPGEDARVIKRGMKRIMRNIARSNMTVIFINHLIANVTASKYQKQSKSGGGHAIKFFSTVMVTFSAGADITQGKGPGAKRLGQKAYIKVEKLKNSTLEYPSVDTNLLNKGGFDLVEGLFEAGKKAGWLGHEKGSKSYTIGDTEFGKDDWPAIVDSLGGADTAYKLFFDWSLKNGAMSTWGGNFEAPNLQ